MSMTPEGYLKDRAVQLTAMANRLEAADVDLDALAEQVARKPDRPVPDPMSGVANAVALHRNTVDAVAVLRAAAEICRADVAALQQSAEDASESIPRRAPTVQNEFGTVVTTAWDLTT